MEGGSIVYLWRVRPPQVPSALWFFLSCDLRIRKDPGTPESQPPILLEVWFHINKTLFQVWDEAAGSHMIDTWEQSARSPGKLHKPPLLALLGPRTLKGAGSPDHIQ